MTRAAYLLSTAYLERQELEHGFAWRFRVEQLDTLQQYIANERRCCPFFAFELDVAPQGSALWLRITGGGGVKAFLQSELDHYGLLAATPGSTVAAETDMS
jgi:hypothetical protein